MTPTLPQILWVVRRVQSAGNVARDAAETGGLQVIDIATRECAGQRVLVVAHQVIVNCMRHLIEQIMASLLEEGTPVTAEADASVAPSP